jgi:hypothetical protein
MSVAFPLGRTQRQIVRGDVRLNQRHSLNVGRLTTKLRAHLFETMLAINRAEEAGKEPYIYQFGDWDPTGRLVRISMELADPPMTVRQAFYQLVVRGVIEKTEVEYQNVVIRLISEMRMHGDLPWDSIVDESRRMRVTQTFDNIQDAIAHTAQTYRRSAMKQSDPYLEIWCAVQKRQGRHSPRRH